jgi:hypothetical protein
MSTRHKPGPPAATEGEKNWRCALIDSVNWQVAVEAIAAHLRRVSHMKHGTWYHTPRAWYSAPFR